MKCYPGEFQGWLGSGQNQSRDWRQGLSRTFDLLVFLRQSRSSRDLRLVQFYFSDPKRSFDCVSAEPTKPVEVFYSYAHEDELLRDELKKQLASLKRQGLISEWYDRDISPGNEWNAEIENHLNSASVILLLISPDFIDSDYCNDVEVKRAMERQEDGSAVVIPVILRATNWKGLPFSKLQALPTDARAVTSWANQDEAFFNIAPGIGTAIN